MNKYFNDNVKKIRITSNKKYPGIKDEHLSSLHNLTELIINGSMGYKITDREISCLTNLTVLEANRIITNDGISNLTH